MKRFFIIAISILSLCGCRTTETIRYVDRNVYVHDTASVHDTTTITKEYHDSSYVFVRDSSWIDSIGRYHHDRYEKVFQSNSALNERISVLEEENKTLRDSSSVKTEYVDRIVEKEVVVTRWYPFWIMLIMYMATAILAFVYRKSIIKFIKRWE